MTNKEDFELVVYSALTAIEDAKEVGKKYENHARNLQDKAVKIFDEFEKATKQAHQSILKKSIYTGIIFFFGVVLVLAVGMFAVMWYTKDLRAEVIQLREQAEYFKSKAGKANLTTCGDEKRLCVQVEGGVWTDKDGNNYMIIHGY